MAGLAYKVEDRSLLLPLYKRVLLEPLVPRIPARVHPNALTHAGHLFNLAAVALVATRPAAWSFAAAALLVQLYNFCDNADGAHARRTNQCSAKGELLDHGLDMLNVAYIAVLTAASVGAQPAWTVALAVLVPAAAAATCWEQAETGIFHLGRINQVEALTMLSIVLVVSASFGVEVWASVPVGPIALGTLLLVWTALQTAFGMLRALWRVARANGASRLSPAMPLVAFNAAVLLAMVTRAASPLACVVMALAANVAFGLRMLAVRLAGERPKISYRLATAAIGLGALVVWKLQGRPVGQTTDVAFAAAGAVIFGALGVKSARDGARRVAALDAS